MKYQSFLIKYAEIGIKGKNRNTFEDALVRQMKISLKRCEGKFTISKSSGRIFVDAHGEYDFDEVIDALSHVFGIAGICPMRILQEIPPQELKEEVVNFLRDEYPEGKHTFKMHVRRLDKRYPFDSMELNAMLGEAVLEAEPERFSVDVHEPEIMMTVEIRERIYMYSHILPGPGGLPVGSGGKAMLCLSGGIDSPVSTWMIARRGVRLIPIHFFSFPYTSQQAKEKVVELARLLTPWCGRMRMEVVPFTHIQEEIRDKCPEEYFTLIMRRFMMRIAQRIALDNGARAIVTGENLGQVASQTMEAMASTQAVIELPVLQPLIGMDKGEIVAWARKIGTFDTSILPYEDCCTVFTPRHPRTHPTVQEVEEAESVLDVDALVEEAILGLERIAIGYEEKP